MITIIYTKRNYYSLYYFTNSHYNHLGHHIFSLSFAISSCFSSLCRCLSLASQDVIEYGIFCSLTSRKVSRTPTAIYAGSSRCANEFVVFVAAVLNLVIMSDFLYVRTVLVLSATYQLYLSIY